MTHSNIIFTLKLESRNLFCSNKWIRSSTYGKKICLIFLHAGIWLFLLLWFSSKLVSRIRRKWLLHGGIPGSFFGLLVGFFIYDITELSPKEAQKASRKPPGSYKKSQGRNPEIISLVFWEKLIFHKDIIKLTDL